MKYRATIEAARPAGTSATGRWATVAGWLLPAIAVAALALLPRLWGLADFLTTDEAYHWISRTGAFAAAVAEGRWDDTLLTGHPGVTLMWLGGLGLRLERLGIVAWVGAPDRLAHLAWLRLGPVFAHALAVAAGYLLLRRLVRPPLALLAAALWATAPFLVAHGRLLHLDALLADLVTLTLLATLCACFAARPWPWLLLAGLLCGLALLTKGPALIMLPVLGLTLFALGGGRPWDEGRRTKASAVSVSRTDKGGAGGGRPWDEGRRTKASAVSVSRTDEGGAGGGRPWDEGRRTKASAVSVSRTDEGGAGGGPRGRASSFGRWSLVVGLSSFVAQLWWSLSRYALLLGVALLTAFALWPALWVEPGVALTHYMGEIIGNGGQPTGWGQFFLGRAVGDPGPLFYPLVGLYRLTPLELLGLALLPLAALGWARASSPEARRERATLLALAALALFWLLVMSAGAKKFDRYILPAWPALMVLSAAGLVEGWAWLRGRLRLPGGAALPLGLALAAQLGTLAWYHPYYLSYYSPLLGGGPAAQRLFLIGWGEGMDQAGAWLSQQPDIANGQVASDLHPTLQPFVPAPTRRMLLRDKVTANYAVVYLESLQTGLLAERYASIQATVPLHTVTIHGIEYARIYQLARPFTTAVGAEFGGVLRLPGYTATQEGATLTVTPAWDVRATPGADLTLFLFVLDAGGKRVAQVDVRPGGASYPPTDQWQAGRQVAVPLPLALPPGLPAGEYTLALGLYDPASGVRLPLTAGVAADPAVAGPDAALLGRVTLTTP